MITKDIENLTHYTGKDAIQTFQDFLDYCLWVFGVKIDKWPYKKEVSEKFYEAFYSLMQDYKHGINTQGWCDPLGDTFMELIKGIASFRGQFFTPDGICRLMAEITTDHISDRKKQLCGVYGYRIMVSDPTAGSARNLLAIKNKFSKKSEEEQPYFIAEDIDPTCCKMCAINMCVHGCYGEVICHNTLSEPASLKFGYIINIGIRYGQLPSITFSDNPMMFETTCRRR